MATPYSVHLVEEVTSTQDLAVQLFAGTPILVVAHQQSAGRGRSGSTWTTAPRAVAASLALRPPWPEEHWPLIPLVAGVAAAQLVGVACKLKWPNDLLVDGRKVGGLLSEASFDRVVIGCGINLFWPQPPDGVGAVNEHDPGVAAVEAVARAWADDLTTRLTRGPAGFDVDEYRGLSDTIGRWIAWEPDGYGQAVDVASDGGLIVRQQAGVVRLSAGDVRHLRPT